MVPLEIEQKTAESDRHKARDITPQDMRQPPDHPKSNGRVRLSLAASVSPGISEEIDGEEDSDEDDIDCNDGDDGDTSGSSKKHMSSLSRFFIGAALFHACAVIAFQGAILGLAKFSAICEGGVGVDRKIYAILFMSAMVYVIVLVIWALYSENIVEVYAFCVIQILSIAYSCTQVIQFYDAKSAFEGRAAANRTTLQFYNAPSVLAVSTVIISMMMMVFYLYSTYNLYIEFGWKIYTTVPFKSEAKLRGAFRSYQIFTCFLKLELFFTEMFLLSHVTLLLSHNTADPEFSVSIIALVLAIVGTCVIYWAVRREQKVIMVIFLMALLAMIGYYSFKVFRFVTQSCPLCERLRMEMLMECGPLKASPAPTVIPSTTAAAPLDNLAFEHLILFAAIVDINTALLFIVSLRYMSKFGSGLKKIFRKVEKAQWRYARSTVRSLGSKSSSKSSPSATKSSSKSSPSATRASYMTAVKRDQFAMSYNVNGPSGNAAVSDMGISNGYNANGSGSNGKQEASVVGNDRAVCYNQNLNVPHLQNTNTSTMTSQTSICSTRTEDAYL